MGHFLDTFNNYGVLKWTTEGLQERLIFLDLGIWIGKPHRHILFKSYSKPMNLFLFIPANSAHPPKALDSMIKGMTQTFWIQNSSRDDFLSRTLSFYKHLRARGHTHHSLAPKFVAAVERLLPITNNNKIPDYR